MTTLCTAAAGYALENLALVEPADLGRATPCPEWDLRQLVLHLADVADALTKLIMTGELSLPTSPRTDDADPVTVAQDQIQHLLETLAGEQSGLGDRRRWKAWSRPAVATASSPSSDVGRKGLPSPTKMS